MQKLCDIIFELFQNVKPLVSNHLYIELQGSFPASRPRPRG